MSAKPAGSGFIKILLVVMVFLGVAGAAVIGGVWYVAHRVKQAVIEKAQENGVDLGSIVPPTTTSSNKHRTHKACDLLSKEEAASMLGEPIERTEYQDGACMYYGPSGLAAKLAADHAASVYQRAQAPGGQVSAPEMATAAEQLVGSLGAASGGAGSGGEMPLLMLSVEEDGRGAMAALNVTAALAGGIAHAADPEGKAPAVSGHIKGLGDQAVLLPKLGLHVLQGDTVVGLLAGPVPGADSKTVAIAHLVIKRL
ncbi:MAG TPA: hypothetical protein VHW09_01680 [Bryobacteraceae bacterium]|jgi:hypothetical protein|nr:hypothetical protein [Bryobacteraceae bacterium]